MPHSTNQIIWIRRIWSVPSTMLLSCLHLAYIAKCFLNCSFSFDHTLVMQIMFPILENLDRANLVSANHYWLFNVNIRDRRFEVFDSWRSLAQSKTLDDNARLIAATVRSLWDRHYHESRVSLDDFRLKEIDVPKQDNEWVPFIVALSPSQKHDFFVLLYMLFIKWSEVYTHVFYMFLQVMIATFSLRQ